MSGCSGVGFLSGLLLCFSFLIVIVSVSFNFNDLSSYLTSTNTKTNTNTNTLAYYQFASSSAPALFTDNFPYFAPYSSDGTVSYSPATSSLSINSVPFTSAFPAGLGDFGFLDHVKLLAFENKTYVTDERVDVVCEANMRAYTVGTEKYTVDDEDKESAEVVDVNDPRLAVGAMINGDFGSMIISDFFITNTTVYALYERLPFARTDPPYAVFSQLIPVYTRTSVSEFHLLSVRFSSSLKTITWSVNGKSVLRVSNIGYKLPLSDAVLFYSSSGGFEETVPISNIKCGFGTFSLLDNAKLQDVNKDSEEIVFGTGLVQLNSLNGYEVPKTFRRTQTDTVFGQGAVVEVKHFHAYSVPNSQ